MGLEHWQAAPQAGVFDNDGDDDIADTQAVITLAAASRLSKRLGSSAV